MKANITSAGDNLPINTKLLCRDTGLPAANFAEFLLHSKLSSFSERILVVGIKDAGQTMVAVEIQQNENKILKIAITPDNVTKIFGRARPLKEEVFKFADKEGHTPDLEWLEAERKKQGIRWSDKLDDYVVPAKSVGSLILSFALSSAAMVVISRELVADHHYMPQDVYKIHCCFFGKDMKSGWDERYLLPVKALEKYVAKIK